MLMTQMCELYKVDNIYTTTQFSFIQSIWCFKLTHCENKHSTLYKNKR